MAAMTYQSKTVNWPHQEACHDWVVDKFQAKERGLMLALPMGVGKSKLAVDIAGEHAVRCAERSQPCKVLVLCPLSVAFVWPREFRKHCGLDYSISVDNHLSFEFMQQENPLELAVLVVHYDAAWREPLRSWLLAQSWNIVIADESHKFKALPKYRKNPSTGEWEVTAGKLAAFMADLSRRSAFRLCLTGTPMAHSPQDVFSQVRFLDHGERFGNSSWQFLQHYGSYGGYQGKTIVGWQHRDELSAKYNQIAWTCPPDVVQLPEAVHEMREFSLGKEAEAAYAEMWRTLCAEVEDGEITAANGAVAFLRLQQITSGIGKLTTGNVARIDKGKQQLLEDFLDDLPTEEKVVVFCQFRDDLAAVKEAAETTPGRRYAEISGSDKSGLSPDALFAEGANILGVQLQSGGVGVDLTAARYCVYFSPGLSLANYEQSLKRVWRPGQTKPVLFLHLIARHTIDQTLYDRLQDRKDLVEGILELARTPKKQEVAA